MRPIEVCAKYMGDLRGGDDDQSCSHNPRCGLGQPERSLEARTGSEIGASQTDVLPCGGAHYGGR